MSTVQRASVRRPTMGRSWDIATIQFCGLIMFTVVEVTSRWPYAYPGMIIALVGMIFGREKIRFPAPFWWGVTFLAWALISSFFAMSHQVAVDALYDRLKVMLIFLVVMNALRTEKQLWIYLLVFVASFMIYPARGTIINYVNHDLTNGRVAWNGIYDNPNDLAAIAILAAGVALSVAMSAVQSKAVRWGSSICAVISILIVLLTKSRGGFLGLAVGVGPPLLLRTLKRPALAVYAVVAVSVGLAILPDTLWTRLAGLRDLTSVSTIREADKSGSAESRWQIQKTAWSITVDHPIFGVGVGCYKLANNQYRPDLGERDTHDTYLNLTAELGLPGLLLWGALVLAVLRRVKRAEAVESKLKSSELIWLKYGVFGFLIEGIFGTYSGLSILYVVLGTMWSAATLTLDQGAKPLVGWASTTVT